MTTAHVRIHESDIFGNTTTDLGRLPVKLHAPSEKDRLAALAKWHSQQMAECYRKMGRAP